MCIAPLSEIDHWIVWEGNTRLSAAKIEADVLTFEKKLNWHYERRGAFVAHNPLRTIWNFLWSYRCLVPFAGADLSASMPSEREVYQEWRRTKGQRKYSSSSSVQVLSSAACGRVTRFWTIPWCLTSNRYGLDSLNKLFCTCQEEEFIREIFDMKWSEKRLQ